jgi:hypothetical protein
LSIEIPISTGTDGPDAPAEAHAAAFAQERV